MAQSVNIVWPGWDVGDCIGKGGYGVVYEIRREVFGDVERCALKVITIPKDASEIEYMRSEGMDDESITTTLHAQVGDIVREYKMMSRMRENPNVVHCDDFRYIRHEEDLGWDIYIRMELLTPLMKALDKVQTDEQIIRLGKDMCSALMACQKYNIIHRDIKPQNIFLSPEGYFKLGDFGIARTMEHTTKATAGMGTYSFMAPEVALGKTYGPTVDIYSLGLVLYWLLNERRGPFVPLPPVVPTVAVNEEARVRRYSGERIPPPKHGSDALKAVVLKACAFSPNDRYKNAYEMMDDLKSVTGDIVTGTESPQQGTGVNEETVREHGYQAPYGKDMTSIREGSSEENGKKWFAWNKRKAVILIAIVFAVLVFFSWDKREATGPQLSTETGEALVAESFDTATSEVTATTKAADVGIAVDSERLAILRDCAHIFEVINTPEGIATSCRFCGASMEEVEAAGVPLNDVECEHTFETIIQTNGTPAFECTRCHSIQIMPVAPLTSLKKLSDTNSEGNNEDVIVGASCKFKGMEITDAIRFWVINAAGYSNSESVEFYLANSYSTLSGIVFAGVESENEADMTLRFYGDGNLIEEITDITVDNSYFPEIDVSGVEVLRIECTTSWKVHSYCYLEASVAY